MPGLRIAALALVLLCGVAWMVEPAFWPAVKLFAAAWAIIETAEFIRTVRSHRPLPRDASGE